jgi:hypothetical protein
MEREFNVDRLDLDIKEGSLFKLQNKDWHFIDIFKPLVDKLLKPYLINIDRLDRDVFNQAAYCNYRRKNKFVYLKLRGILVKLSKIDIFNEAGLKQINQMIENIDFWINFYEIKPDYEVQSNGYNMPILWRKKDNLKSDKCPFCNKLHSHGYKDGHRIAHCIDRIQTILSNGNTVDNDQGYIIKHY